MRRVNIWKEAYIAGGMRYESAIESIHHKVNNALFWKGLRTISDPINIRDEMSEENS